MTRASHRLGAVSLLVLAGLAATPAYAAGTASGTSITNTVTVNYSVNSAAQTAVSASTSFTVDRKINLTVAENGSSTTNVTPGQLAVVTTFTVTNLSNAPLDFALAASNAPNGAGAHSNTDNFDVSNFRIFVDSNNDGIYQAGTDTQTFIDELAADGTKNVFVVTDVPSGRVNGDVAAVFLTATGKEAGAATTLGAALTNNSGTANTIGVDTVFADTASLNGDAANNAAFTAIDDYTVAGLALTAVKTSTVLSDPVNGASNPHMIPGATVEYCIAVANGAGGVTATGLTLSDILPATTTFVSGSIKVNGTVNGSGVCSGGTTLSDASGYNSGTKTVATASGVMNDLAAGAKEALIFQVTVN